VARVALRRQLVAGVNGQADGLWPALRHGRIRPTVMRARPRADRPEAATLAERVAARDGSGDLLAAAWREELR